MLFDHDHGKVPSDLGEQRVDWLVAMGYGAIGGAVVEAVVSSDRVLAWNAARHQARARRTAGVPELSAYVDPLSDVAAGLTRILLGAVAGLIFHTQVTGAYAAIAVGCSAPTVLRQLGSARLGSAFEVQGERSLEHGAEHGAEQRAEHGTGHGLGSQSSFEHEAEHQSQSSFDHGAEHGPGPQPSFEHEAEHEPQPSFDHEAEHEPQSSFDHGAEDEPERQPANPPAPRPATAEDQA